MGCFMATQVEICNMALGLIGAENITAISDATRVAKVCNTFYASTLKYLLRSHNWNFAMKRAVLTSSGTPAFEFSHQVNKPSDYLRVVEFYNYKGTFKEEGSKILLNQQSVQIKYIRSDVVESEFDESFVMAFASKLAEVMCWQITQNATKEESVKARHKEDIAMARRMNAISNTPDPFQEDTWIATRL